MILVSEVQAKIKELEDLIAAEKGQVGEAIDLLSTKLTEALVAAQDSGQDLSALMSDLERVTAEVKAIYEPVV